MAFLYMMIVVSVVCLISFYAIELYREFVARYEEEQIIAFEKKTVQDMQELDLILTYMELVTWNVKQVIELKQEDIVIYGQDVVLVSYDQPPVRYHHGRTHQPGHPRSSGHVHLKEPGLGP
jgi:hypothetical protein